jgi:hypothetical protein
MTRPLLLAFVALAGLRLGADPPAAPAPAAIDDLGVMDGFYRYSAVLGVELTSGIELRPIPAWMEQTDFPYPKRPGDKEVPFADALSVVRLLGWGPTAENDLVTRDAKGALVYHWDQLKARLDPYVSHGYSNLTLVLDEVPFCLTSRPSLGEPTPTAYGQAGPPDHTFGEWRTFIQALCAQLKVLYGTDTADHFRFRLGTEMQGRERFTGTLEEYFKYYDYAGAGIRAELPDAPIGPFNQASVGKPDEAGEVEATDVPSLFTVARHCASGKNFATGGIGAPLDFLARSYYYVTKMPRPGVFSNVHPDERTPGFAETWRRAMALSQRFAHLSREVQELGPSLVTEGGITGPDTGARGAAQAFHTVVQLHEIGADRLWHWPLLEKISRTDPNQALLMSQGWDYAVMDQMRGGEAYVVPVTGGAVHGNTQKALFSVLPDRAILMVSNWNVDRVKHDSDPLTVRLPASILPSIAGAPRMLSFTEDNSVYDVLRRDLAQAGLLSVEEQKHRGAPATLLIGRHGAMAADPEKGRALVVQNWAKYEQLMRDSLTLKPFAGTVTPSADGTAVAFTAASPSVTVIVLPRHP